MNTRRISMIHKLISFVAAAVVLITACADNETSSQPVEEGGRAMVDPADITYASSYDFEKLSFDETEKMEFSCTVEAELAAPAEGVSVMTDKAGYSGEGYVDISNNPAFSLTVEIPASQFYKVTARHCAGGHKENPLFFNGSKAMNIVSESGDWVETTVDGIYLEKGTNTITIGDGWSWFSLDSITIQNGETLSDSIYEDIDDTLCNPYANLKTQNTYQYLKAIYGKRTLAGQCTNYGTNNETDAIFGGTGKHAAVRTFDFIYDSMSCWQVEPPADDVDLAIQWSNDGGIVVYDWHWNAPYYQSSFYADKTDFTLANAVTDMDIATLSLTELEQLYNEGKITIETYKIMQDIDNISSLMQRMEDENVTVLWRPLHEASGGWFWWGSSGADAYKWLWKLMYHRMTDYHELDNLIWVWNAQSADWYVGDEYCDIAAIDIYNPAYDYSTSPARFADMSTWTGGKMVTMSECATVTDPDLIVRDNAYWLWFAVWNWDYMVVGNTSYLSEKYTTNDMLNKVYNSEVIITRDELPEF